MTWNSRGRSQGRSSTFELERLHQRRKDKKASHFLVPEFHKLERYKHADSKAFRCFHCTVFGILTAQLNSCAVRTVGYSKDTVEQPTIPAWLQSFLHKIYIIAFSQPSSKFKRHHFRHRGFTEWDIT